MSKAAFANGAGANASGAKRHHACLTVDGIVLSFIGIILLPQLVIHAVFAAACGGSIEAASGLGKERK
jgi:hypothetical protein